MTDILTRLAAFTQLGPFGLLPCPVCGNDRAAPESGGRGMWVAQCRGLDCVVRIGATTKHKVIERWNTRYREAALIALVQEAAGEIEKLKQWQTLAIAIGTREEERIAERALEEQEDVHG